MRRSAVRTRDLSHDRQADATSAVRERLGTAREWSPDSLAIVVRDALALILDGDCDAAALRCAHADAHCLSCRSVLHRVVEQVQDDVAKRIRTERDRRR